MIWFYSLLARRYDALLHHSKFWCVTNTDGKFSMCYQHRGFIHEISSLTGSFFREITNLQRIRGRFQCVTNTGSSSVRCNLPRTRWIKQEKTISKQYDNQRAIHHGMGKTFNLFIFLHIQWVYGYDKLENSCLPWGNRPPTGAIIVTL